MPALSGAPETTAGGGDGGPVDVDGACEVTADCREPLICIDGECVAPNANGDWCDGIDRLCPLDGSTCVGGFCVFIDGGCTQNADCPAGYVCNDFGRCEIPPPPTNDAGMPPPPEVEIEVEQ